MLLVHNLFELSVLKSRSPTHSDGPQQFTQKWHCWIATISSSIPTICRPSLNKSTFLTTVPPLVEELLKDVNEKGKAESPTATRFAPVIAATDRPPFTQYHSKYFAFELTKRVGSDQADKLAQSLRNATVDLNPHQVEAALFAFRSPLSRGAILADEVGLGKTIEAGIIVSQLWAEKKRRILVIAPASLRKQWSRELAEKFFIPSVILETKSYRELSRKAASPFDQSNRVIICSYQFARAKAADVTAMPWDLVVIEDESK